MNLRGQVLNELFDTTQADIPVEIEDEEDTYAINLEYEGKDIEIRFNKITEWVINGRMVDGWEIWFSIEGSFVKEEENTLQGVTGLFGVVLHAIEDFFKKKSPSLLVFTSKHGDLTRKKLFDALVDAEIVKYPKYVSLGHPDIVEFINTIRNLSTKSGVDSDGIIINELEKYSPENTSDEIFFVIKKEDLNYIENI